MTIVPKKPSQELRAGRRGLEGLAFCELVEDLAWQPGPKRWALKFRMHLPEPCTGRVPSATDWFCLVPEGYPWGDIDFYPAKACGLLDTFPHQNLNLPGSEALPWREGKICQSTSLRGLGRRDYDIEPMTPHERLAWNVERAWEWTKAASEDKLVVDGDPFELPFIPPCVGLELAFSETAGTFVHWTETECHAGQVVLKRHSKNPLLRFVTKFLDPAGKETLSHEYGPGISNDRGDEEIGIWIRTSSVPVLPPWKIPTSISELSEVLLKGVGDIRDTIFKLDAKLRDGRRHMLLLGFPVPDRIGEAPVRLHWLGLWLPILSCGHEKGIRPELGSYRLRDKARVLTEATKVEWGCSGNWAFDQVMGRGQLPHETQDQHILIVGVGALGSAMASSLARAGAKDLTLVDGERLSVGNLCRHRLGTTEVLTHKAESLAKQLNSALPHSRIGFINKTLQDCNAEEEASIKACNLVVDCTGSDSLLRYLASSQWPEPRVFASVSLGLFGKRQFYFVARGTSFPHDAFAKAVLPFISGERHEYEGAKLPRDGIGCWHPTFPARVDDIDLHCAMAIKMLVADVLNPPASPILRVLEQTEANGLPTGVQLKNEVVCP